MSKKNNQNTRRKQHSFDLAKEAEAKKKSQKKAQAASQKLSAKPDLKKKKKTKGIRIKKNVTVAGIRVRDAASKRAAKEAVKERREAAMQTDD
mmetsp:Transcript_4127/g.11979  ORF Transcript_4127/g.11979 Transcript_4127/m.11979 type:complete len:93 (-) Transcript_4127:4977-5255(-)